MQEILFGTKTRSEILRLLFDGSFQARYVRDLERESQINASVLLKELKKLQSAGLLNSEKDGNRIYYQANRDHPIYIDLVSIVDKTMGIQGILKMALNDSRIQVALLFGSIAHEEERAESDVDLLIIGKIGLRSLTQMLAVPQKKIARPLNPIVFTPEEFSTKLAAKNHFLTRILEKEFVVLAGDVDALIKPHKKRATRS